MGNKRTVMPSSRNMDLRVEMVPLYIGPLMSRWERGSDSEWIWSCRRILTTSSGATQNLWPVRDSTMDKIYVCLVRCIPRDQPSGCTGSHYLYSVAL